MNERIFDMARQSGATDEKGSRAEHVFCFTKDELKGFAQLIAEECARLAMTQHCSTSPDELLDMEPYEQGRDDTASTISGLIRRTFGVEE